MTRVGITLFGVSGAILAGGQSKRMGQNKLLLEVGGRPVLERVVAQLKPLTDDLLLSTNDPAKYLRFKLPVVADIYPNRAALGGIYSVMMAARYPYVLVVAGDMPFLQADLLHHLLGLAGAADVIIPQLEPDRPQTLLALYSKRCLPVIKSHLLANELRVIDFLAEVSVHYVERDEIAKFDPNFYSFINMNTPSDWDRCRALAGELELPTDGQE